MTTIDDHVMIEKLIFERNVVHLNQAQITSLKIESLRTKVETDGLSHSRTTC